MQRVFKGWVGAAFSAARGREEAQRLGHSFCQLACLLPTQRTVGLRLPSQCTWRDAKAALARRLGPELFPMQGTEAAGESHQGRARLEEAAMSRVTLQVCAVQKRWPAQRLPEAARGCQRLPEAARGCQRLPEAARGRATPSGW
jgi:hypothetical protein